MPGRPTDHANLDLVKLHADVAFGRAGGKVIWQPRIGCWLHDKQFAGQPLPKPYEGMTLPDIYRSLGCSNRIYEFNRCFQAVEPESVRTTTSPPSARDKAVPYSSPFSLSKRYLRS